MPVGAARAGIFGSGIAIPDSVLTQDLTAWYRFEDGDARDYTATLDADFADSTAYNGTVNGATHQASGGVTDFEEGDSGTFGFDGVDDYINIGQPPVVKGVSNVTYSAWVKFNAVATGSRQDIFGTGSADVEIEEKNGQLTFYIKNSSDNSSTVNAGSITTGEWYHIVGTYDGSQMKLYFDGAEIGSTSQTGDINDSGQDVYIGAMGDAGDRNLDGLIDDFRLYNRSLTGGEISDIYDQTKP